MSEVPRSRRALALRLMQVAVTLVVVGFVVVALARYWGDFRTAAATAQLRWPWILASGALFLGAHLVLVQTWRVVLHGWGARIPLVDAMHIFTVSSLARYVPGKLWQIGAMGMLAQRAGVAPTAAAGSAIISTVANIATGMLVVMLTGWPLVEAAYAGARTTGIAILLVLAGGLALTPLVLPWVLRRLARRTSAAAMPRSFPPRAIVGATVGNLVAWGLYGIAFQLFTIGVLGATGGSTLTFITVYTLSYVFGYLMLFAPAGVGYREAALVLVMPAAGLATVGEAGLIAIASRLWLTMLETIPGMCFLAFRRIPPREQSVPGRESSSST